MLTVEETVEIRVQGESHAKTLIGKTHPTDRAEAQATIGYVQLDQRLNDVDGFNNIEHSYAQETNALALLVLGDFYDTFHKRMFTIEDFAGVDFRDMNATVKYFIEGMETQLRRLVLFLGYYNTTAGEILWIPVPIEKDGRWHKRNQEVSPT